MKTAIVVVDMVKDNLELSHNERLKAQALAIVDPVNRLCSGARQKGWPVIFTTDSFLPGDALFRGKMPEHSLRGTDGAEISGLLNVEPDDTWLPKRRMSGFFKTDLDQTLRLWSVERVAVCGLMTPYCVLTTALDAVCLDFYATMVEDACNAPTDQAHASCLELYRKSPLRPVLTVQTIDEVLGD